MSAFRGPRSEAGLDRMLDHWLAEGPDTAPDRVIEGAIRAAVATNQRQVRGRLVRMTAWHSPAVPVGLTVAGIAAVAMLALGLSLIGDVLPGDQSPEPTISPPPSLEAPAGLRLYTNTEAGFEVLIPRGWTEIQPEEFGQSYPGVVVFGHEYDNAGFLTISVGESDGSFYRCDFACEAAEATSLDELEEVLAIPETVTTWTGSAFAEVPVAVVVEDISLAGVDARFAHFDPQREGVAPLEHFAFAIVNGRPVVLTFVPSPNWGMAGYPVTEIIDSTTVQAILGSFRILP